MEQQANKLLITGGSGFVGSHLSRYFLEKGISVTATGTSSHHFLEGFPNFSYVSADTTREGPWQTHAAEADIIVNLAGKNIFHFWTKAYKQQIYESRIRTTRNLTAALPDSDEKVFLSASAAGFYGDQADQVLTENLPAGDDFLATVCRDWEQEALSAEKKGARVILLRLGVVLGPDGGALSKMLPAYKMFAGGPLGSGRQWFPWIYIEDVKAAVEFLIQTDTVHGPVNLTAPGSVRNRDFSKALGRALKRPAFFRTPAFLIKLLMGELGEAFLAGQRSVPEKLLQNGFSFTSPDLDSTLSAIYSTNRQIL